jgi:hypothetical protein
MRQQITPPAVQIWRLILELRSGRRYGELSSEEQDELHDLHDGLSREVGLSIMDMWPDDAGDEPARHMLHNPLALQRWAAALQLKNALNRALAETVAKSVERQAGKQSADRGA